MNQANPVNYHQYLNLDQLLTAHHPITQAHDENMFIVVHQIYELWFKLVLIEVESVYQYFCRDSVDETDISVVVARMNRVIEIFKVLIDQIRIMETMTPTDFLSFRDALFPASGFQSFQFRIFEVRLGLKRDQRVKVPQSGFHLALSPDQQKTILQAETEPDLFALIEQWLERLPFLEYRSYNFLEQYKKAVIDMFKREEESFLKDRELYGEEEYLVRLQILERSQAYITSLLEEETYNRHREAGEVRLSYPAMLSALMINLYREQPILHLPFKFLSQLTELDELISTWRHRHAIMARKMLGKKIGTGGSSGYDYLKETISKHSVYNDFVNLASLFIPEKDLPKLPLELIHRLGFHYSYSINPTGERVRWYPRIPDPEELK